MGAGEPMFHLALRDEWSAAEPTGRYERSTIGLSLAEVGFIHCSFADQVDGVARLFYAGRSDVVLLRIDPARLDVEVRVESLDGGDVLFPHIYGALPVDAVVQVDELTVGADGHLDLGPLR